jgi:riboflavin synthase
MFTGIVEELGRVASFERHEAGARLSVACATVLEDTVLGSSVAVNGVCLTAVELTVDGFSADLAPETLERTNLLDLAVGDPVNLERPVTPVTRLGGHIVQGHVDGTGVLESYSELGDGNWSLQVRVPAELDRFLVYKGSICLDGISLTVAGVADGLVRIAVIPHTHAATNLSARRKGDRINVECDILAKHVDRLLRRT